MRLNPAQSAISELVEIPVQQPERTPPSPLNVDEPRPEKPQGKREPLRLSKTFRIVPRGLALVIGCNTFPTWNSYPGLFASLVTGNPVVVKPHRRAVLPLAITVAVAREVLAETGFDPNVVCLAVEGEDERLAPVLATRPEVK